MERVLVEREQVAQEDLSSSAVSPPRAPARRVAAIAPSSTSPSVMFVSPMSTARSIAWIIRRARCAPDPGGRPGALLACAPMRPRALAAVTPVRLVAVAFVRAEAV